METDNWHIWCRLCAKNDASNNINIFLDNKRQVNRAKSKRGTTNRDKINHINLANTIKKFFQLNINRNEVPKLLCSGCYSLLATLENFSERVTKVQSMYKMLQKTSTGRKTLDMNSVRIKYGLAGHGNDDVDFALFPEVQLLELKQQIDEELEDKLCEEEKSTSANPLELLSHIKTENLADELQDNIPAERITSASEDLGKDIDAVDDMQVDMPDESSSRNAQHVEEAAVESAVEEFDVDDFDSVHNDDNESKDFVLEDESSSEYNDSDDDDWETSEKIKKIIKREKTNTKTSGGGDDEEVDPNAPYTCSECKRVLNRYQDYRLHMKRVHKTPLPPPQLKCLQCNSVFETVYRLKQHSKLHLPIEERRSIPCDYCDKKFLTKSDVNKHVRHDHMKERFYICEECGMELRSLVSLKVHMYQHSGFTPFKCEICGRGYKEKSKLKGHMEIHENKKYECHECGRQLNTRLMLHRHLIVHSDVRRFKCDFCGREFKRSKALKVHLIMHTGLKPYVCNFCERAFSTGSSCRLHKRTMHPEELAAYEAAGGAPPKPNLPSMKTLMAITKASNCLRPVGSQQQQQKQQQQQQFPQKQEHQQQPLASQQNNSNLQTFIPF